MLTNTPRKANRSAAAEIVGCLLIIVSLCMFIGAHRHHSQLEQRQPRNPNIKIFDGELMSSIIRGVEPFPVDHANDALKFHPGSLAISSAESIQHCYVDMDLYKAHFDKLFSVQISVSEKYKLIYRNVPKSASSSSRRIMQDFFEGKDIMVKHHQLNEEVLEHNYTLVSFIRDPLDRFYSSYDEAFLRMGPWWGTDNFAKEKPGLHKAYMSNRHKVEPYPYLYEGMKEIYDYRKMYCPRDVLDQVDGYMKCVNIDTIDDGNLTRRFEQFVHDYDGTKPIDNHLRLQIAFLVYNSRSNGAPLLVSVIYNASDAHGEWAAIAHDKGVIVSNDEMTHGRKTPRRFNLSLVTNATKQRICKLLALDYCCLNMELPEVCRLGDEDDNAIFCTLEEKDVKDQIGRLSNKLVIQSYRSYISLK